MIRVVRYFVVIGFLAYAATWLADRPGDVVITWQERRIEMSVMVLITGIMIVAVITTMLWSIVRAIMRSPGVLARHLRARRGVRGYQAVSGGLIAVGSGDARTAHKLADEANRIAPGEPLTLLLTAQASQLAGDRSAAERTFQVMAGRDDTRILGLHGLFIEAQRRDDAVAARLYAEEAASETPVPPWAGQAVLQAACVAGDWNSALARLEQNMKSGLVDRGSYQRQRAVLLTAIALSAQEGDLDRAKTLVLEAVKLAPTLVPAAALAGRMLGDAGDHRRAARIVESAWKANPHPDLADTFAYLRPGVSARDRLARVDQLAQKSPGHIEAALAVARAALDAQEFAIARNALEPLLAAPTQRVAMLMAELEETEHGDEGRAREWMTRAVHARRDPAWTADGFVSERWMPVSPVTGRLDAFQWKEPLSELGSNATVIDGTKARFRLRGVVRDATPKLDQAKSAEPDVIIAPVAASVAEPSVVEPPVVGPTTATAAAPAAPTPLPEVVSPRLGPDKATESTRGDRPISLVHIPDDPGPIPEPSLEPTVQTLPEKQNGSWGRLKGLFW
jgi:HemY protein